MHVFSVKSEKLQFCSHRLNTRVIAYTDALIPPVFTCSSTLERAFGFNISTKLLKSSLLVF